VPYKQRSPGRNQRVARFLVAPDEHFSKEIHHQIIALFSVLYVEIVDIKRNAGLYFM
jgi:mannose-6-phosphate isomerase-like protein (cupin superfamily)